MLGWMLDAKSCWGSGSTARPSDTVHLMTGTRPTSTMLTLENLAILSCGVKLVAVCSITFSSYYVDGFVPLSFGDVGVC
jgi:hypothetical protein